MNKADYIELVDGKLPNSVGGSKIPSKDHRDTMHTDPNSIIELVYGGIFYDKESDEDYTIENTLFSYKITFNKVGSDITLDGSFKAKINISAGANIFKISYPDLFSFEDVRFNGTGSKGSDLMPVYILNNAFKIGASVVFGEEFYFSINYKALN